MSKTISIVVPCFNESEVLPLLFQRLKSLPVIDPFQYEYVFVDDGSTDDTWEQIRAFALSMENSRAVKLSRNFGHQRALWTGFQQSTGDSVFVIDADLQDPPELIEQFVQKWAEGNEVVYGVRRKRKENLLKRAAYKSFYRLLRKVADMDIPLDAGDFCLMDRKVVNAILCQNEVSPFVRGARAWVGFEQVPLEYERDARAAGKEKYGLSQLLDLAVNGLFSYSKKPVHWILNVGMATFALSIVAACILAATLLSSVPFFGLGVATTLFLLGLGMATGMNLVALGIVGEYVVKTLEVAQARPVSVIADMVSTEAKSEINETISLGANPVTKMDDNFRKAA